MLIRRHDLGQNSTVCCSFFIASLHPTCSMNVGKAGGVCARLLVRIGFPIELSSLGIHNPMRAEAGERIEESEQLNPTNCAASRPRVHLT